MSSAKKHSINLKNVTKKLHTEMPVSKYNDKDFRCLCKKLELTVDQIKILFYDFEKRNIVDSSVNLDRFLKDHTP